MVVRQDGAGAGDHEAGAGGGRVVCPPPLQLDDARQQAGRDRRDGAAADPGIRCADADGRAWLVLDRVAAAQRDHTDGGAGSSDETYEQGHESGQRDEPAVTLSGPQGVRTGVGTGLLLVPVGWWWRDVSGLMGRPRLARVDLLPGFLLIRPAEAALGHGPILGLPVRRRTAPRRDRARARCGTS